MSDLPIDLGDGLAERLALVLDVENKIPRTLEALGPVGGRDVVLLDGADGVRTRQLTELGARITHADGSGSAGIDAPDDSADVLIGLWSSFRGDEAPDISEAERVLRPGGRLLIVHDYGRDDVSRLRGDLPEYGTWGRRGGPFLGQGFRVRVIHCFWTFDSIADAADFLGAAFHDVGRAVAAKMKRPRLSYKVAVYHRTVGESPVATDDESAVTPDGEEPCVAADGEARVKSRAKSRVASGSKSRVGADGEPRVKSGSRSRVTADSEPGENPGAEPHVTSVAGPRVESGGGAHH